FCTHTLYVHSGPILYTHTVRTFRAYSVHTHCTYVDSGSGEEITHSYIDDGIYQVNLTVIDDDGDSNTTSQTITIVFQTYHLTIDVDPLGSGSISLSPAGGTYDEGTIVTATTHHLNICSRTTH
ncbi:MAG: PKD domain-containing protein, partial [Deltaproteobacteria bacterium]|nr:PKD domain-containing protein [Deltaproteobacteria bacterium]